MNGDHFPIKTMISSEGEQGSVVIPIPFDGKTSYVFTMAQVNLTLSKTPKKIS